MVPRAPRAFQDPSDSPRGEPSQIEPEALFQMPRRGVPSALKRVPGRSKWFQADGAGDKAMAKAREKEFCAKSMKHLRISEKSSTFAHIIINIL